MEVLEKTINFINDELKLLKRLPEGSNDSSENEIHFFQTRAAQNEGYFEPFTYEQTAMNNILRNNEASRELTEKTWSFYHKCRQSSL